MFGKLSFEEKRFYLIVIMGRNCCPGTPGGRWKESEFPLTLWRCDTNHGTPHLGLQNGLGTEPSLGQEGMDKHILVQPKDKKSDPERLWVWVTGQSTGCRACGRITMGQS